MEIYVDLRCLQDANFAFRGIGYHSSTLLRAGRHYLPKESTWIGLIDPELPDIPVEYADLVDQVTRCTTELDSPTQKLFVQLSPMTHPAHRIQRFLTQTSIFSTAVVYDFIPLDLADRYLTNPQAIGEYAANLAWLGHFDRLFPISQYAADRLLDLVDIDPRDVHVTGVSLRPDFEAALGEPASSAGASDGLSPPKFFLFVGGADRRKNLDVVLKAHAQLELTTKPDLVIVGGYSPRFQTKVAAQYRSYGGDHRQLRMKQNVSDAELARLYRECVCSICSSEIEGFSLPPVEAIACGGGLLVSHNAAHRELISSPEIMFDPHDCQRLSELMRRAVVDRDWVKNVSNQHRHVAERCLLERVAYRFWGPIDHSLRQIARAPRTTIRRERRKRIAFLTPFPPDRSGVADYTRRAVEEIGKLVDVDIYCETENPQPTAGVQNFLPLSDLPYQTGDYDQVVSIVGNSHFHTKIIDAQVKHGGPCLIHDNRLAELYHWWKGPKEFQQMASRSLGRSVSFHESQAWVREPGKLPSMFFDELIPGARPLIVHSKGIRAQVQKQYGVDAQTLPLCVYRDFAEERLTPAAKIQARRRLGIADDTVAIVTLGLVDHTKAPKQCLEAIAMCREAGLNCHLYFVGPANGMAKHLKPLAAQLKVQQAIHLCGDWLDEQTYTDYIVAADMAVQLRTHFFGGLSGAMLDCIASGLVTIANQDLAEALESPASVLRIADRLAPQELAQQILTAHADWDLGHRLTPERSQYIRQYSFDNYARQFLNVLGLVENTELAHRVAAA